MVRTVAEREDKSKRGGSRRHQELSKEKGFPTKDRLNLEIKEKVGGGGVCKKKSNPTA